MNIFCVLATFVLALSVTAAWSSPRADDSDTVYIIDVYSLQYPYISPADNRAALAAMLKKSSVQGTYATRSGLHFTMRSRSCRTACLPDPHIENYGKLVRLNVNPTSSTNEQDQFVRLTFRLPKRYRHGDGWRADLLIPLAPVWQQPSFALALRKASTVLPANMRDRLAQRKDDVIFIRLPMPHQEEEFIPRQDYCAYIDRPLRTAPSGTITVAVRMQPGHGDTQGSQSTSASEIPPLSATECKYITSTDIERSYLWKPEQAGVPVGDFP